jgi:hypothetical protein
LITFSCRDEVDDLKDLKNTNWELTGLVDEETGEWIAPEPVECDEQGKCYTLAIDENGMGVFQIVFVSFHIDLRHINSSGVRDARDFEFPGNGHLFFDFFYELKSFKHENNILILLNKSKKKYLQFKLVES